MAMKEEEVAIGYNSFDVILTNCVHVVISKCHETGLYKELLTVISVGYSIGSSPNT